MVTIYLHKFSGVLPAGDIFVTGWHSSSSNSVTAANSVAANWASQMWSGVGGTTGLRPDYQTGTVITKVTTSQLNTVTPFNTVAVAETDVDYPGTASTANLPQSCAVVVSLRTSDPSRKGRGRMYLPAPVAADLASNGELASTTIANWMLSLEEAWSISSSAGEHPVIFSRSTGLFNLVIRFGIGPVFDVQRRRVNKVNQVRTFDPMP